MATTPEQTTPPQGGVVRKRGRSLAVGGVCLLLLLAFGVWWLGNATTVLRGVQPSCTVGVTGYAASVTVQGWDAQSVCDRFVNRSTATATAVAASGDTSGNVTFYHYQGTPSGSEVCAGPLRTETYIVRDQGDLMLVGKALCRGLFGGPLADPSGEGGHDDAHV